MINKRRESGFTLVEVAVVVPMIILIVMGILAMLIILVRNNSTQSTRSGLVNDTRLALTSIEKDIDASSQFYESFLPNATFQDYNEPGFSGTYKTNGTLTSGAASTNLKALFMKSYNQIADPQDSTGTKVIAAFKGTPPCTSSTFTQVSNIVPVAVLYFVSSGNLYRRTIIDRTNPVACGPLLVKQSCPLGVDAWFWPQTCTVKDVALLRRVSQFKIDYYLNPGDTIAMNAYAAPPTPTTINYAPTIVATITTATSTAGSNVSYTSSLRMSLPSN